MALNSIRDYLHERKVRLRYEWQQFQKVENDPVKMSAKFEDKDFIRIYHGARNKLTEKIQMQMLQSEYDKLLQSFKLKNLDKKEPFQYFTTMDVPHIPLCRTPAPGINILPLKYHKGRVVEVTPTVSEEGYPLHPLLQHLINSKYPQYMNIINKYCRPLGTTDATFSDFNRTQIDTSPFTQREQDDILPLVIHHLGATPFQPIHFIDTLHSGMPLSTGTGYHNRHSFKIRANAKYSHPQEYADKPTSKGYVINAVSDLNRTLVHRIKYTGLPLNIDNYDLTNPLTERKILSDLAQFIYTYPTTMYTRNHVSIRNGVLKQRPVYAVDELFLTLECMVTFPLHLQARQMSSCIMYSLETMRGSNKYLDAVAQHYQSYFTVDWSSFDQTIPFKLVRTFWHDFLPSLLIINHGYHSTFEYPNHPTTDDDKMAQMLTNLLEFIYLWYKNMVFLSQDGFAYQRLFAGIPSGMLNTQYLDSYCNLFVMIHAMIEFGIPSDEIKELRLFIMGDDNSAFTNWPLTKTQQFIKFLADFAKIRYNMKLNIDKTITTAERQHIQTLSYECNFGSPKRPIGKLLAQLCYPEHGHTDTTMSARAIGIAYASCAQDYTFYLFCKDVYHTFLPYAQPLTQESIEKMKKYLPGVFKLCDEIPDYLTNLEFPKFSTIRTEIEQWKGPLSFSPKWNPSHFVNPPNYVPTDFITLKQYNEINNVKFTDPPFLQG